MSVAIIAWCSLIGNVGSLNLAPPKRWHRDGPRLAVEFARIARGGTLDLCLVDNPARWEAAKNPHPTCWAEHASVDVAVARENLRMRLHMPQVALIGAWQRGGRADGPSNSVIAAWCLAKGVDAAVWCAAPPREPALDADAAVAYLRDMHPTDQNLARAYVQKAPAQIQTPFRARFRDALGWRDEVQPAEVYAD